MIGTGGTFDLNMRRTAGCMGLKLLLLLLLLLLKALVVVRSVILLETALARLRLLRRILLVIDGRRTLVWTAAVMGRRHRCHLRHLRHLRHLACPLRRKHLRLLLHPVCWLWSRDLRGQNIGDPIVILRCLRLQVRVCRRLLLKGLGDELLVFRACHLHRGIFIVRLILPMPAKVERKLLELSRHSDH